MQRNCDQKQKVNFDAFELNALEAHRAAKYSRAFKGATIEYAKNRGEGTSAKKDKGAQAMADCWNKLELYSSSDKQLSRTVITDAVNAGRIGVSPHKRGKSVKVGPDITSQLAQEATMMQALGSGEGTFKKMDKLIQALTVGTARADTLNSKYTFRKA